MKKNIFIAVLISIIVLFSFSSCDEDKYEWRRGTLNLSTEFDEYPIETDDYGSFEFWYDLNANNIKGLDVYNSDIVSVESLSSEIFLFEGELFVPGDLINIRLNADGVRGVALRMIVESDNVAVVIDEDYNLLRTFMADMAYSLVRKGQLRFYVEGELLDIPQYTYFDFKLVNKFDFEIRY